MYNSIIFMVLLFVSFTVFAKDICVKGDINFKKLVEYSIEVGLSESYKSLLKGNCNNKNLLLSDKVGLIGGDEEVAKEWILSDYDNRKFFINLAVGQHYFKFPEERLTLDKYSCPNNIASTEVNVFSVPRGKLKIVESWSCGSKGCSYEYMFFESDNSNFDFYCE